ncbi:MAG: AI-2E family transporter [Lachnospiraceae bacterium]|nr:AI-2E family transporter [Lachnospiraceae bacterium]
MDLNKKTMKKLMLLIVFTLAVNAIIKNPEVISVAFAWVYGIVSPVVLGVCFAFVLNILLRFYDNRLFAKMGKSDKKFIVKLKRPLSLICTLATMIVAIVVIVSVIFPQIVDTLKIIVESITPFFGRATEWLEDLLLDWNISVEQLKRIELNWEKIQQTVIEWVKNGSMSAVNIATSISSSLVSMLFNFILAFIIAIYILLQKEAIFKAFDMMAKAYLKEKSYKNLSKIVNMSNQSLTNFVTGQLLEALILGTLCFFGMLIFKFPYAPVVSVIVGITALIPMFGAWIGGGISALLILMVDPMQAAFFLLFIIILQQIEGNLIYPKVVGQSMGLPGLLVLLSVVIGGNLFGVIGILLGVPFCSVVYALIKESVAGRLGISYEEKEDKKPKKTKQLSKAKKAEKEAESKEQNK